MSSFAELEMLEMSLTDGYGWVFEGEYDADECGLDLPAEAETFRVYLHDDMPGVRLYLVDPGERGSFAFVLDEESEVEERCDLSSWDDDFDYDAFNAMLESTWYSRR